MGFWGNLINGVKNVSSTVGKVAGALSGIPGIGAVASTVANVANMVNKGAGIAEGIYNTVVPAAKEIGSQVKTVVDSGKQAWNVGKQAINQGMGEMRQGMSPRYPVRQSGPTISAVRGDSRESGGPMRTTVRY